jgi:nucleoside-diphosphate-sugar epimerase
VVRGRLADSEAWGGEVARLQPEACVHLAWTTTPGSYLVTRENLDWLTWSGQLLSRLPGWGCRRIVGVGTCAEYDADHGYLRESTPLRPLTLYAACKVALRAIGQQLAAQDGVRLAWARIFHLFGPGEDPRRLVPACIRTLLAGGRFAASSGTQVRDFLHVDDVAGALLSVLESDVEGDVNVCSGRPVQVGALLRLIERTVGGEGAVELGARPPGAWDPAFLCGDNSRLLGLGWQPRHSLDGGIEATVRWWRDKA